jgi:beta-glucosidase
MNIYRHSQCGRNFEYLGEDPHLASTMIEKYVIGLQNTGVAATLKHFAANSSDYFRRKSNSIVDERTLHEIYLPAFKAGIDAGAMAVMTSYNLINGEWCSQNINMIKNLLREKLGFEWLVMTDWWAIENSVKAIKSGLDLEMPAFDVLSSAKDLIEKGVVEESDINRMVLSILKTCLAMGFYNNNFKNNNLIPSIFSHEKTALEIAEQGIVLLKNRENILPLVSDKTILLTGKFVEETAQIYIHDIQSTVERPEKELKAYKKVFLHSGEKTNVQIELKDKDFSFWDESKQDWFLEPGDFTLLIGSSSRDIHLSQNITIM